MDDSDNIQSAAKPCAGDFRGDLIVELDRSRPMRCKNQQTINTRKPQHPRAFPGKGRERRGNF